MISVVMATRDGQAFLQEQLGSILDQLGPDDELVVSDNGSTDGTFAILSERAEGDGRIRLLSYTAKQGVVPNFAHGLSQVRGDVVLLSDQDDVWLPGRVDFFRQIFDRHPGPLLVQTDAELIDEDGRTTAPSFFLLRRCGPGIWKNFRKNTYQGCSMGFRRRLLDLALPFPDRLPMHDVWLGLLAECTGCVSFEAQVLTRHRRHRSNESDLRRSVWTRVALWRLQLAIALLGRLPRALRFRWLEMGGGF